MRWHCEPSIGARLVPHAARKAIGLLASAADVSYREDSGSCRDFGLHRSPNMLCIDTYLSYRSANLETISGAWKRRDVSTPADISKEILLNKLAAKIDRVFPLRLAHRPIRFAV